LRLVRVDVPERGVFLRYPSSGSKDGTGVVHGGRVKLRHLQEIYPANERKVNILYLVSSALPPHADQLVRWAHRKGVKVVLNQNGVAYPGWAGESFAQINEGLSRLHADADFVIYQGEFCRDSARRFLGQRRGSWAVLHNCVDTRRFTPRVSNHDHEPLRLLVAGTHQQAQRVLVAIRAVSELRRRGRPFEMTIVGKLDWKNGEEQVMKLIAELGLQHAVAVHGPYSQDDAPQIYRSADILLHMKYKDPCPTVVIEAMACGLPVVGSRSGGMPELVGADCGVLLDVSDTWEQMPVPEVGSVVTAIEQVSRDYDRYSTAASAHAFEQFNHVAWVSAHTRIFQSLIEPGEQRP